MTAQILYLFAAAVAGDILSVSGMPATALASFKTLVTGLLDAIRPSSGSGPTPPAA